MKCLFTIMLLFHVFSFLPKHLNHLWKYCFRTVHVMDNSRVQLIQKGHGTGTVSFLVSSSWVGSTLLKCTCFSGLLSLAWSWHLYVFQVQCSETWNLPYFFIPAHLQLFLFVHFPSFFLTPYVVLVLFDIRTLSMHLINCFIDILISPLLLCWIILI